MSHVSKYLANLSEDTPEAVASVRGTINDISKNHLMNFSYMNHEVGLLLGQVQSGKTSQMFGVMSAAADHGFQLFLVLTSSMTALQQQTFERAMQSIDTFNVCDENDEVRFLSKKLRQPTAIILKKNATVLRKWKNYLASSGYCVGRPIFIIDDEADATSLNTKVNKKELEEKSTINQTLEDIKNLCTSSFYLQVTATPQPLLLQSIDSGWKPKFIHYFKPGNGYLGGSFFYSKPTPFTNISTNDDELSLLLETEETPHGLKLAATTYLITAAHQMSEGRKVCSFLIHPSSKIDDHTVIANKLKKYMMYVISNTDNPEIQRQLEQSYVGLRQSKPDLIDYKGVIGFLNSKPNFRYITMNSGPDSEATPDINTGLNVVVGGNSLGRGVTFKGLQTVYYLRSAKKPQADTFWQHSRMFGYDRDPLLMRVFMPLALYNLFAEINSSNEVLYEQIEQGNLDKLQLMFPPSVKPTRDSVVDKSKLDVLVGGVNYFPPNPDQSNAFDLDPILEQYSEKKQFHEINTETAINILSKIKDDKINNWNISSYISALRALSSEKGFIDKIALIVRRDRNIGNKTGTMLSPDDRKLGSSITKKSVITLYRNVGDSEKGWDGSPFWMPNLKLPKGKVFYTGKDGEQ
ncbi:restriction endonuclease [bacterium]|nr:restriction endonuclease [bacterium]